MHSPSWVTLVNQIRTSRVTYTLLHHRQGHSGLYPDRSPECRMPCDTVARGVILTEFAKVSLKCHWNCPSQRV